LLLRCTELDHQPPQKLCFKLRVDRTWLPSGPGFLAVGVVLDHAPMADENVGAAAWVAFKPRSEFVTLSGGVEGIQHLA